MQFSQIFATFALAVATATVSATPQISSFNNTMAKIKLAHPGISNDAAYDSTVGFMDAVMQLQMNVTIHPTRDLERRGCCKRCGTCIRAIFELGVCCSAEAQAAAAYIAAAAA